MSEKSRKNILVLGAGMIGKTIAADLADDFNVACADRDPAALQVMAATAKLQTFVSDVTNPVALKSLIQPFDLVISALPGAIGFGVLHTLVTAGVNVVDISFFPEDPFELEHLAAQSGATVVVDCGVAPGLSNILLGHHNRTMRVTEYECLIGGLPLERTWPFQYKALFSHADVMEGYIRPCRYVKNGRQITVDALSETELIHCEQVGTLEAFSTDGLRTLLHTMPNIPFMKEKTLRYPGHSELMRVLKHTGFFSKDSVSIGQTSVAPFDVSTRLLFPHWKRKKEEEDFTIMRVQIAGIENGRETTYTYKLFDRYESGTGRSSMARTTGFTCTAVARLMLDGTIRRQGITPPEYLGDEVGCLDYIRTYLKNRNVVFSQTKNAQNKAG